MNAPANPNKALWEKGDFTRIAETMRVHFVGNDQQLEGRVLRQGRGL